MVTPVVMPKLGLTMDEATISGWLRREGDPVEQGDELLEVTTEKANVVVEAPAGGFLRRIVTGNGETASVGSVIGYISATLEEVVPAEDAMESPVTESALATSTTRMLEEGSSEPTQASRVPTSPAARRRARELGLDLATLTGSGPGGRITDADVTAAAATRDLASNHRWRDLDIGRLQRAVATQMTWSAKIPQFQVSCEVDVSAVLRTRDGLNQEVGEHVTITDFVLLACAQVLRQHPTLNAHYLDEDPPRLRVFDQPSIGLAVALDDGLVVPVLHGLADGTLVATSRTRSQAVARARARRLTQGELSGATFTVSNLGGMGVDRFVALLDPPQVAILAVGGVRRLVWQSADGSLTARPSLALTLSVDHRAADGADAARFLADVRARLESWDGEAGDGRDGQG